MAKLSDLTKCLAAELNEKPASVNVLAMELRKNKLLSSTGRGLNAAKMNSQDGTNLVLAVLGGGYATRTSATVKALRRAEVVRCEMKTHDALKHVVSDLPPIPAYDRLAKKHMLGEFMDELITDYIVIGGPICTDTELPITNMSFELRKTAINWDAIFWFDDGGREWTIIYNRRRPELDGLDDDRITSAMRNLLEKVGHRTTAESVTDFLFSAVADCLRGRPLPEVKPLSDETFAIAPH